MNINHVQRLAWLSLKGNDMVGSVAKDHSKEGANFIPCMSMIARGSPSQMECFNRGLTKPLA